MHQDSHPTSLLSGTPAAPASAPSEGQNCLRGYIISQHKSTNAVLAAIAIVIFDAVAMMMGFLIWEWLRSKLQKSEEQLLSWYWVGTASPERDRWGIRRSVCDECQSFMGEDKTAVCRGRCVQGALVPHYLGRRYKPFSLDEMTLLFKDRARICVLLMLVNVSVKAWVIWYIGRYMCTPTGMGSSLDIFVFLGIEGGLAGICTNFYIGEPDTSREKRYTRMIYALMGLEIVKDEKYGGERFIYSHGPWEGIMYKRQGIENISPDTTYFAQRLIVLGQLLTKLGLYNEAVMLLEPSAWDYGRSKWRLPVPGSPPPTEAEQWPPVSPVHRHVDERVTEPPGMDMSGFYKVLGLAGHWSDFVIRFWNKTQTGRNRDSELQGFLPTEVELMSLIITRVKDRFNALPAPDELFVLLLSIVFVEWVLTFITLFGNFDDTLRGALYGAVQATILSFWFVVLTVLWRRTWPSSKMMEKILKDIDGELICCRLTDSEQEELRYTSSRYLMDRRSLYDIFEGVFWFVFSTIFGCVGG